MTHSFPTRRASVLPDFPDWLARLDAAIAACPAPPILVAHSLSCALVDHWVARHDRALKGALLVAPADVDSDAHTPPETRGFRPMPLVTFSCPAIVVASSDDPYVDLPRSEEHTSELQSLMRISYAVFCLKKKKILTHQHIVYSEHM